MRNYVAVVIAALLAAACDWGVVLWREWTKVRHQHFLSEA
jgi:hypothetical protein